MNFWKDCSSKYSYSIIYFSFPSIFCFEKLLFYKQKKKKEKQTFNFLHSFQIFQTKTIWYWNLFTRVKLVFNEILMQTSCCIKYRYKNTAFDDWSNFIISISFIHYIKSLYNINLYIILQLFYWEQRKQNMDKNDIIKG